jgi:Tfp pilus assembly protein PilF
VSSGNADVLGNYAQFLLGECGDHLAAEAMFKRALAARDNHVNNLVAYGQFLAEHRKVTAFHFFFQCSFGIFAYSTLQDISGADDLFKRALAVDCMDGSVTSAYVEFLERHIEADYRCGCIHTCRYTAFIFDPHSSISKAVVFV